MVDSCILNEINRHLFNNKSRAKEQCEMQDVPFREWTWHESDPLAHTFYKSKASERVRVNTASATARRRVLANSPIKSDPKNIQKKETIKKPKIPHKNTSLVIPLQDSNLKIEPSQRCHVLRMYKKDDTQKSFNSLVKENSLLKERLRALESGIVNVEQCLIDPKDDMPPLPKPQKSETERFLEPKRDYVNDKSQTERSLVNNHSKKEKNRSSKKSLKKKKDMKQLLMVVEASLANLTRVLDQMQNK